MKNNPNTEPSFEIKTEHQEMTMFVEIANKRIFVTLQDFRGEVEITIKKQEFIEEDDAWEICDKNIFTLTEIKALIQLLYCFNSFVPQTH
jgi:hypothetical protein